MSRCGTVVRVIVNSGALEPPHSWLKSPCAPLGLTFLWFNYSIGKLCSLSQPHRTKDSPDLSQHTVSLKCDSSWICTIRCSAERVFCLTQLQFVSDTSPLIEEECNYRQRHFLSWSFLDTWNADHK